MKLTTPLKDIEISMTDLLKTIPFLLVFIGLIVSISVWYGSVNVRLTTVEEKLNQITNTVNEIRSEQKQHDGKTESTTPPISYSTSPQHAAIPQLR